MALVRWEPFRELAALQAEMSRWMNQVVGAPGNGASSTWIPAVDAWETDDELFLSFDLPGLDKEDISIELEDNVLTVSGERERTEESSGDRFHRYERRFGAFSRSVTLPQGVTEDDIKADYKNGVLEVRVRKPAEATPKRIPLGGAEHAIEGKGERK